METGDPLVDRLPTELQALGHFLDALSLIESQQCLRAAPTVGCGGITPQLFQLLSVPRTHYKGGHCFTSSRVGDAMTPQLCQRYF